MFNLRHMRRRFDAAADRFDSVDFVHAETRRGLFERLQGLTTTADTVVDLGCATGAAMAQLSKRFGRAHVVGTDISANMLNASRRRRSWFARSTFVQSDARALPFADESIDVVFCNMLLPWVAEPTPVFTEVARVLRKEGLFAFATLGPDSLSEIARAWNDVDDHAHVNPFADMHDIGDGLVNAGLRDPVLDVDRLEVSYQNAERLFEDLTSMGARNALSTRAPGLTGRGRFRAMTEALEGLSPEPGLSLNLELVYGHCWGAGPKKDPASWGVDASSIPIRQRDL